jgi:divalent metal cation (Fe/Co/Zn/Cd) transporter
MLQRGEITVTATSLTPDRVAVLRRRIRVVVAITISWNVIEAIIAISAGRVASSAALVGFGLDSIVEVLSAAAVAWQFAAPDPEKREKVALRMIAASFFGLAAYVSVDAILSLLGVSEPEHSPVGIGLAVASLLVMPFLSWFERRTGRELGSASAVADSKQTLICTYLSAALLVGLLLNSLLGWAWADSVAALLIAGFAVREGIEAWKGDACCSTPVGVLTGEQEADCCEYACCSPGAEAQVADAISPSSAR